MAKVLIEETTLTAIGDAIRGKENSTDLVPVNDMATRISAIQGGGNTELLKSVVDRSVTKITAADLAGLEVVGREAFYYCEKLTQLELPDTVHTIRGYGLAQTGLSGLFIFPRALRTIENAIIQKSSSNRITSVRFPGDNVVKAEASSLALSDGTSQVNEIQVPGHLLDEYKNVSPWKDLYSVYLTPFNKYVGMLTNSIMLVNQTKTYSIELIHYDEAPTEYEVTTTEGNITLSNIVATNNSISFDASTGSTTGMDTISISVAGDDGHTFTRNFSINIFETIEESSYTVESVEGAQYGFALNKYTEGYYGSENKGINSSYALCKVNVHNPMNRVMYIDCINYAEANYDYGIFSNIGQTLTLNNNADDVAANAKTVVHTSLKGRSKADVQTIVYENAPGDCSFYIKFRKDGSGNTYNDSLQFKIRFAEVEI